VTKAAHPFFTVHQFGQGLTVLGHAGFLIMPLYISLDLGSRVGLRLGVMISAVLAVLAAIIGGMIIGGWRKAAHNLVHGCFMGFGLVTIVFSLAFLQHGLPHSTNIAWTIFSVSLAVLTGSGLLLAIGHRRWAWKHDAI
jgi:hypothetical protein